MPLNLPRPPQILPPEFREWASALVAELERFARESDGGSQTQVFTPLIKIVPSSTPGTPPSGQLWLYVDIDDFALKAMGSDGTITDIANP